MPRYAPRSSYRTRLATEEHPESDDLAATTLDRVAFDMDLAASARDALSRVRAPEVTPAPTPPRRRWRLLWWAPVVFLLSIALGALAGATLAVLGV